MSYDSHSSFRLLVWVSPFSALGMAVSVSLSLIGYLENPTPTGFSCPVVNLNVNVWLIIRRNPLPLQPDSHCSKINIISMESDNISSSWVLRSCRTAVCSEHSHCLSPSVFQPHTIYTLSFCLHTSLFHFSNSLTFSKSKLQKMKVRHIWLNSVAHQPCHWK